MKNTAKWFLALLFISVAINIYFIGTYVGHISSSGLHKHRHEPRFSMRQLTSGLPKEVRKEIGAAIKERRTTLVSYHEQHKALHITIVDLLGAEQVDVDALREAFKQQRVITGEIQSPAHEALLDVLPKLDQQTRIDMIKHMQDVRAEMISRRTNKHSKKRHPDTKHEDK